MSLSGEEPKAPMSLSGEEPTAVAAESAVGPRVSRNRAAAAVIGALTVAGVVVGAVWAWLAPPIHGVVALTRGGERVHVYLGSESDHFFTAAFLLLGMLMVLAVIAGVAVWQWRVHRGPVLATALSLGCVASAAAASAVGAALVHWRYGIIDIAGAPVTPEHRVHYVVEAPPVFFGHTPWQIAATLLSGAAVAALVYALTAVSTSRDDLGAWPPVEAPPVLAPLPVSVIPPGA